MRNAIRIAVIVTGLAAVAVPGPRPQAASPDSPPQARNPTASSTQPLPGLDPRRPLIQFARETWSEREGLAQNFVNSLAQTPDGYLWIGSERGLTRFDGARFTHFTAENTPELPISWVRRLHADPDGTLWIGTGGEGVVRLRAGRFMALDAGLRHGMVSDIVRDADGRLWVATQGGGVHRLVDEDSGSPSFRAEWTGTPLESATVLSLAAGRSGTLWVGTDEGLFRADPDAGIVDPIGPDSGLPRTRIPALAATPEGGVRVGTPGLGLYGGDGTFERLDSGEALTGALVTRMRFDRQGALWVATNGDGLFRWYEGALDRLGTDQGFPSDLVWTTLEDREGNLWVGTNIAGLVRLTDGFFDIWGAPEGLSMDVALALLEDRSGAIWAGTPGEGLNRIQGGQVRTFRAADGLGSDIVLSVAEDAGDIWAGLAAGGVSRIRSGTIETFGVEDGVAGSQVTLVHTDREGRLWLGVTGAGVQRWSSGRGLFRLEHGVPGGGFTSMADDAEGRLWVGTREGLARIDPAALEAADSDTASVVRAFTVEDGLPSDVINQVHVDDAIWVATMAGIARIEGDEVLAPGPEHGLPDVEPMAVISDGLGALWITSSRGVTRVDRDALVRAVRDEGDPVEAETFGRADGLRSAEANGGVHPAIWQTASGEILFPTMAGVVRFDPADHERAVIDPTPVVETVQAGDTVLSAHHAVTLPPEQRSLEFRFTAPHLSAPDDVRLRYQLEGFDDGWVEAGERRSAVYPQLPPREYVFRVQAAGRSGEWSEVGVALPVQLEPRFAERRVVQMAGVLLLILLAALAYRWRIRTLEARENELLTLVRERERTEGELRRSEERLRMALEAGRMGTWEWVPGEPRLRWSRAMDELTGLSPDSFAELVDGLTARAPVRDASRIRSVLERAEAGDVDEFHVNFAFGGADTEPRHLELRGQWVNEPGEPGRRLVGVAWDVSALIRTREALREREEELRQSQKMEAVGQLAGGVAHDFNNLLAVIGANARLALHDLDEDHPAHEELVEVVRAGDRATTLTQQLLAFGRKQVLRPRSLDLNEVVSGVTGMMVRLIRENVTVEIDLEPALPAVYADQGGVEQILVNLILNAQDAMPRGGTITLSTGWDGDRIEMEVRDTGHGIPAEIRDRVFEPFFTTKEQGKGTGMGLASVYGIVQQSGAEVEMDSELGRGTRFRILFPVAEDAVSAGRD